LREQGWKVAVTREPGGTALGKRIREIVLAGGTGAANEPFSSASPAPASDPLTPLAELALMFAARTQHVERVIAPALHAGQIILCDRFTDSSMAYQGYGRGIALEAIGALENLFCGGIRPDLTLVLEIDPVAGLARASARNQDSGSGESRFEEEGREFFRRVQRGYREIARLEPERVRVIDARGDVAEVHERVRRCVDTFLKGRNQQESDGV